MTGDLDYLVVERQRLQAEYQRRHQEISPEQYAPWQPAEIFMRAGRNRLAAQMLHQARVFPRPGDPCLEVGYGTLGWLGELINWGLRVGDLHGIELNADRASRARKVLPGADLWEGDAAHLPWEANSFRLVVASTVFTSILDARVRHRVAEEISRVLVPGGALLWYDFAVNNPRNPQVRKVNRRELKELFPGLTGNIRSVTLAPPLTRWLSPRCWALACCLEGIPWLRTHLLAVLVKPS